MTTLLLALAHQPFALLFLVVAAGYALGRVKVRGVGLGATAATLVIGLGFSLLAARAGESVSIPDFAGTMFFNLFMFSIGMKVGPQFVAGIRRDAARFIAIGLFVPLCSVAIVLAVRALLDVPPGTIVGLFAGANTATPGLGAAKAAFASELTGEAATAAVTTMSTTFALTYCLSTILFVVLTKVPDLLGGDLVQAAKDFEAQIKGASDAPLPGTASEFFGRPLPVALRSYQIERPLVVGRPLRELRAIQPQLSIERVLRGGEVIVPTDDLVLQLHDTIALHGQIPLLVATGPRIGPEVYERVARDVDSQTVDVIALHPDVIGKTLRELVTENVGHGLYLNAMFRAGEQIPAGPETMVHKGDVLRVTGSAWRIKLIENAFGKVVRPSLSTDIATLALGVALGALIGAITIPIGRIRLQVGAAVGLLVVGIALSIARTRRPQLGGPFPEPARKLFEDLGLNVFVAGLGLSAGGGVIDAFGHGSLGPVLLASLVVGFVPAIIVWAVARRWWKMNDALLLGAVAGGRCNSAGLASAQEATASAVPAISYPATFALSNIVFTVCSYVIALLR